MRLREGCDRCMIESSNIPNIFSQRKKFVTEPHPFGEHRPWFGDIRCITSITSGYFLVQFAVTTPHPNSLNPRNVPFCPCPYLTTCAVLGKSTFTGEAVSKDSEIMGVERLGRRLTQTALSADLEQSRCEVDKRPWLWALWGAAEASDDWIIFYVHRSRLRSIQVRNPYISGMIKTWAEAEISRIREGQPEMRKQTVAPFHFGDGTVDACRPFYQHDSTTCGGDGGFDNKHGHTSKVRCTASRICFEASAGWIWRKASWWKTCSCVCKELYTFCWKVGAVSNLTSCCKHGSM